MMYGPSKDITYVLHFVLMMLVLRGVINVKVRVSDRGRLKRLS